jgi:hypothetical protein
VVKSDAAERIRYKLQQDKNEYLQAATSAMQHFIERERKRCVWLFADAAAVVVVVVVAGRRRRW